MRMPVRLGLAAILILGSAAGAAAWDGGFHSGRHHGRYGTAVTVGSPFGYGADVGYGSYGAPLRFPRPNEIVPPAWGYGTYGVPTMPGIRQAPTGTPTVYVIESDEPRLSRPGSAGPRILSRRGGEWASEEPTYAPSSGPRIVQVRVPRR